MATSISSASSSFLILQPLKPPKHSGLSKAKTLSSTIKATSSQPKPNNASARKPTSRNRRRSSYGSSRRSALKKTFAQEQVTFTAPVSSDPHVGIIGGGMAGLACALSLDKRGVKSTVFDTGNHGLGGRMGTRMIGPQPLIFDHAAQFFTVNDSRFHELVDGWLERGLVRPWEGVIGELETSMVSIVRPCWISNLEPFNGMWHLSENVKLRGQFDVVVIAHNGKCANRLLGSSGLPQIARQMKRLELSSIWALLAAFEDPLPLGSASTFEGAFVKVMLLTVGPSSAPQLTENETRFHRGAALPTNTPSIPCIFDPHGRAGICGDWLLGSSVESAALSGMALANHIADYLGSDGVRPEEFAVGLHNDFQSLEGHDIGQFPGLKSMEKEQLFIGNTSNKISHTN
ncbi:hypothetical protein CUMW_168530 [Citrus unshiu]|uniref:Amine oxidase domain-containing protein n=1 Tax=Citrus unshiu TaxID=55188 RepID=A0A2H5PUI9_CITUN|nr:hypothetical protein CUMW_168530 [Citrus unshiu]